MQLVDQHTYGFPAQMACTTTPALAELNDELGKIDRYNVHRHNHTIRLFQNGMIHEMHRDEMVVLALATAIQTWCGHPEASTGYGWEHITLPMINAFQNMLNLDLRRLDGGVLSAWVCTQVVRVERDPDTDL